MNQKAWNRTKMFPLGNSIHLIPFKVYHAMKKLDDKNADKQAREMTQEELVEGLVKYLSKLGLKAFFMCMGFGGSKQHPTTYFSKSLVDGGFIELFVGNRSVNLAEVYIKRSAIITKGEKGSEMWQKFFGL